MVGAMEGKGVGGGLGGQQAVKRAQVAEVGVSRAAHNGHTWQTGHSV